MNQWELALIQIVAVKCQEYPAFTQRVGSLILIWVASLAGLLDGQNVQSCFPQYRGCLGREIFIGIKSCLGLPLGVINCLRNFLCAGRIQSIKQVGVEPCHEFTPAFREQSYQNVFGAVRNAVNAPRGSLLNN